ncbi:MAG: hypothetical protein C0397_07430 [Odoribacter sp.]|nr:hypothetical protein [Odoribacter sp.]
MKRNAENFQIKRSIRQLIPMMFMLAFMVPVVSIAQSGKVDFSGNWTLNAEKSIVGEGFGQRMGGGNVVATQEANLLTVVRTRTNQNGENVTTTSKYSLDGKESINTSTRGESKSVATWSADGKALTIETSRTFDMNGESRTMKSSEVWTLTDAKTLSVQTSFTTPDGEQKSTRVYDKQ